VDGAILEGMELFLPQGTLQALRDDQTARDRAQAELLLRRLLNEVEAQRHRLVDVANADGARRMASATFLLRAVTILSEVRLADNAPVLATLGVRTAFELAVVGRYMLVSANGPDEFRLRYNVSLREDEKLAAQAGLPSPPPPVDFLAHLVDSTNKIKPRTLADIVDEIDQLDGRDPLDNRSLRSCYRLLYKYVSNSAAHASLSSIKRDSRRDRDVLLLESNPPPIFSEVPVLLIGALVGELAYAVFTAMGLPTDKLPSEMKRPDGPSNDAGTS
jgi:hypothetical protein